MPELPEVETIVRELALNLPCQKFLQAQVFWSKLVFPRAADFSRLGNLQVLNIFRRGKFICVEFEKKQILVIHLKMTGQLILERKIKQKKSNLSLRHERAILEFQDYFLHFCDLRKFGRMWIDTIKNYEKRTGIYKLGLEPFSAAWTYANFRKLFNAKNSSKSRKRGIIKNFLLDQSHITGIGNIYADESLFAAKIKPKRKLESLSEKELKSLFKNIKKTLAQGVSNRGTSLADYVDAHNQKGRNQNFLKVYGRGGEPCDQCGKDLSSCKVAGRGTVWCEHCQR